MHKDKHGVIYVVAGRIVDAVITLAGGSERTVLADADDAMIEMLCWTDATFRFQYEPLVARRTVRIRREREWLIQEGTHRRSPDATPSLSLDTPVHLEKAVRGGGHGVMLTATQWQVLKGVATGGGLRHCTRGRYGMLRARRCASRAEPHLAGLARSGGERPQILPDYPMPVAAVAPTSAVGVGAARQAAPMPMLEFAQATLYDAPYLHQPVGRALPEPAAVAPTVQPLLAAASGAGSTTIGAPPPVKRGMLNAIMSRIRSL